MKLALNGGEAYIKEEFTAYNSIGKEEVQAAVEVLESGVLSSFIGRAGEYFLGGPKVREFEEVVADFFGVRFAVSVNSWTSGLIAGMGSLELEPGDEVIVSPWTMCASATSILQWNAIPVFADIDPVTLCLDPTSVEARISNRTKAIMSVDIGGHPADTDALNRIAKKYHLKIMSDTAQAPGAKNAGRFAGTLTDVGGYSLNYHKHIHTGEGGLVVTNDPDIALRAQMIRNHAEAVVDSNDRRHLRNMVGYNFRLGEIEAAIGIEQMKKLPGAVKGRQVAAEKLISGLSNLSGLQLPETLPGYTHAYYMFFMKIDPSVTGVSRDRICDALRAEGVPGLGTKFENLHLLPMFQQKIAFGSNGAPWTADFCTNDVDYSKGICPVAEGLHDESYLGFQMCVHEMKDYELEKMIGAFCKVWDNLEELAV